MSRPNTFDICAIAICVMSVTYYLYTGPHNAKAETGLFDVVGQAYVPDGDSLKIGDTRIRLHGIDAPELYQECTLKGFEWACGEESRDFLKSRIGGAKVECQSNGKDRYGRTIATCFVGGLNLNQTMVKEGWAVNYTKYTKKYKKDQDAAEQAQKYIWKSDFVMPWAHRKANR